VRLRELKTGGLALSELAALVEHLPSSSTTYGLEHGFPPGWTLTDFFLTDLWHAQTGQPHPARDALRKKAVLEDARARLMRQRARLAAQN